MTAQPSGRQVVSAIAWTAAAKWISQIVSWASLLVIVRILTPADFGLFGLASTYLGLLSILSEFGIGTAVVTMKDLDERHYKQLNSFSVLLGGAAVLVSALLAWPLGLFFRMPDLPPVLLALSGSFLVSSFRSLPSAILQKDLQFRLLSVAEAMQVIVQALITVGLALAGFQHWALVGGSLAGVLISAALIGRWSPSSGYAWPDRKLVGEALTFSKQVLFSRLSWYAYSNADRVIAGRVLGAAPLGIYTLAWNFANLPIEKLTTLVLRVAPAFFSRWSVDLENLKRKFVLLTETMAVVLFPCVFGLMILSDYFIALAAGPKWSEAVVPQQLLVLSVLIRSVATLVPILLSVLGGMRVTMWNSIATAVLLIPAFYIGSAWGIVGIAAVWLLIYPFSTIMLFRTCFRLLGLPAREYALGLVAPMVASAAMVAAVYVTRQALPPDWPIAAKAGAAVATGIAAYSLSFLIFFPGRLRKYRELVRGLRGGT